MCPVVVAYFPTNIFSQSHSSPKAFSGQLYDQFNLPAYCWIPEYAWLRASMLLELFVPNPFMLFPPILFPMPPRPPEPPPKLPAEYKHSMINVQEKK